MIKKNKILSFFGFLMIFISVTSVFTSAKFYNNEIPLYTGVSGGAFFEVYDTALGQVTVVFPIEFKESRFAFSLSRTGVPVNIINVTNSTVYGNLYTSNGSSFSCRSSRQGVIEYQYEYLSGRYEYRPLRPNMSTLVNTNMQFLTDDVNYYNQSILNRDYYIFFILLLITVLQVISIFILALRKGR